MQKFDTAFLQAEEMKRHEQEKKIARRELWKLAPLAAFSAFAVPSLQSRLLDSGRELMSRAQQTLGPARLAPTFTAADLTPLRKTFP
jgi:hypothetical protein